MPTAKARGLVSTVVLKTASGRRIRKATRVKRAVKAQKRKRRRNPLPPGFVALLRANIKSGLTAPQAMKATWKEIKRTKTNAFFRRAPDPVSRAVFRKARRTGRPERVKVSRQLRKIRRRVKNPKRPTLIYKRLHDIFASGHATDNGQFRHKFSGRHKVYGLHGGRMQVSPGDVLITDRRI